MMKAFRKTFSKLAADTSANALAFVGLSMVPLTGVLGLGIDVTQWVLWKRELHTAADLGALAGARALAAGQNVNKAVKRSLAHNDLRSYTQDAIENAPLTGPYAGDDKKVRVQLSTSQALPFSGLFLATPPTIRVEATAEWGKTVPNCVITLDTSGTGVEITGSATVDMTCGLASNSNFDATSSKAINAGAISAVGTVSQGSGITSDTKINEGIASVKDPFTSIPQPDAQTSCTPNSTLETKNTASASPGCYRKFTVKSGTTTLAPGVYIIGEGGFSIAANATVQGTGVTLIFTNTDSTFDSSKIGTFSAAGTSTVKLVAPTSGIYEGVIMILDPRTPNETKNWLKVTGDGDSNFEGAIYAPSTGIRFTGNSTMNTDCMQIVSKFASFEGSTSITNTCDGGSGADSFGGTDTVRLVR